MKLPLLIENMELTEGDLIKFQLYQMRQGIILWMLVWFLLLATSMLMIFLQQWRGEWNLLIGICWLSLLFMSHWIKLLAQKNFRNSPFKNCKYSASLDHQGITIDAKWETGNVSTLTVWEKVYKLVDRKDGLYIYISKNAAHIIPKRSLDNPNMEVVKSLCREYIKPSKLVWFWGGTFRGIVESLRSYPVLVVFFCSVLGGMFWSYYSR